jgi:hypothetical protein
LISKKYIWLKKKKKNYVKVKTASRIFDNCENSHLYLL